MRFLPIGLASGTITRECFNGVTFMARAPFECASVAHPPGINA